MPGNQRRYRDKGGAGRNQRKQNYGSSGKGSSAMTWFGFALLALPVFGLLYVATVIANGA
jgi:hypothetical protein